MAPFFTIELSRKRRCARQHYLNRARKFRRRTVIIANYTGLQVCALSVESKVQNTLTSYDIYKRMKHPTLVYYFVNNKSGFVRVDAEETSLKNCSQFRKTVH